MKKAAKHILILGLAIAAICGAFILANHISDNKAAQELVARFGYFGIVAIAIVGGLNIIVPIHAATFTPIFVSAGFSMPSIIICLAVGTTLADLAGYAIGRYGRNVTESPFPKIEAKVRHFVEHRPKLFYPGVFLYSAFIPFPNEAILLPLGLFGIKLWKILIPFILGTIIHQTIFAYGFNSVFELLF